MKQKLFTLLTLLLCLCSSEAWATDKVYAPTPAAARLVQDDVLITGTYASKKVANTSSVASFYVASGSYAPVSIISKVANIKSVTIRGNRDTGSNDNTVKAFNLLTSADLATFTTPKTGFTATKDNNGTETSVTSLSDIPMVGNNQSYATVVTVTFDTPVMGVELTYSNSTSFSSISVTYDDAITVSSQLCEAHASSTTAYTGTGCTVTTDGVQSGVTISTSYYYNKLSGDDKYIKLDLGTGNTYQEGDEIWIECNGNGVRVEGVKLNSSASTTGAVSAVSVPVIGSGVPMWVRYVTTASSPWKGQQSLYVLRNSSNSRIYGISVHRATPATAYTVSFDAGTNGTCDTESLTEASAGAGVTLPTVTPNSGYAFNGWFTAATDGTKVGDAGATYKPSEDVTLYAQYSPVYTVTYKANGSGESDVVDDNATTIAENPFTWASHRFAGWNTQDDGEGTDWSVGADVTSNLTLYAQWVQLYTATEGTHTNGTIGISPTSAAAGETVTLTATPNDGYMFSAWDVYKTGETATKVSVSDNEFTMPTYDVTVNAMFTEDTRAKVLYITESGSAGGSDKLYAALSDIYNVTVKAYNGTATVTDYDLVVLHESINGTRYATGLVNDAKTSDVPVLNTKSYFYNDARWGWGTPNAGQTVKSATLNTVAYSNVASHPIFVGVVDGTTVEVVTTAAAKAMQPVTGLVSGKEGYTLATTPNADSGDGTAIHELTPAQRGVSTAKYLLISVSNAGLDDLSANGIKLFKNAAAYLIDNEAQWVPAAASYTVTYKANGGTGDDVVVTPATTIADNTFTAPSGKAFIGWNTASDGTGDDWAIGATVTSDLTLYAQWDFVYTVSFNLQGHGAAIDSQNILNGGKVTEPAAPTADGWVFGGWYKEATCTNAWNFSTDVVSAATVLFAKWTEYVAPTSGILFSADVIATSAQSFSTGTTAISASQATITGGKMYAISGQNSNVSLINKQSSVYYFTITNNNTIFKIELDDPLKAGDVITANGIGGTKDGVDKGLWITTSESRPASAPACAGTSSTESLLKPILNYTVTEDDDYEGARVLYVHRAAGASTYFDEFTIMRPATVTVGAKGYATYCNSSAALDFTGKSIKAYTISSTDGEALTLTNVNKVAKNTPLLLYSSTNNDSQTIPAIADSETMDATTGNRLVAGDGVRHIWEANTTEHYVLVTSGDYTPGFYRANNSMVAVGKAYLDLSGLSVSARSFTLDLEDGITTGIQNLTPDPSPKGEGSIYTLSGQKVQNPKKGLYIVNGKKVLVP